MTGLRDLQAPDGTEDVGVVASHADWEQALRHAYHLQTGQRRHIRLPGVSRGGLAPPCEIVGTLAEMEVRLNEAAVLSNMQEDKGAFDGWILALKAWLGIQRVCLFWEEPTNVQDPHYQRFLYRAGTFRDSFPGWFTISRDALLDKSTGLLGADLQLNVSGTAAKGDATPKEAKLEQSLVRGRLLHTAFGLEKVDRQLPVGLFSGRPSAASTVFPRGKSAIDMFGIDGSATLWLFELKAEKNTKIGILSEALCYGWMMRDLLRGRIQFSGEMGARTSLTRQEILSCRRIEVVLLAPSFHPLIGSECLDVLNAGTNRLDVPIRFRTALVKLAGEAPSSIEGQG